MATFSIVLSLFAFTISLLTFWLTRINKGTIKMTRPSVIFFGPDGPGEVNKKVFIRTLLYSTADKGIYVQNMFIRLRRGESHQNFNVWIYDNGGLVRGSGLFINKSGIACNHHFLLPKDGSHYNFLAGEYLLEVFVETVGNKPIKLFEHTLSVDKSQEEEMKLKKGGIYFDWAPNSQNYLSHLDIIHKHQEVKA
ncbi:hypothetical protein [Chitinophaga barathri]|uniref:Uncharacterized protein n=1 Tax=Chitinophaga barathri TaxID=1647451 RepID=A0A3N4M888_9BACT|nr:hypothetical protein [Chitinophaga barathri]RPD39455.1 hypothetical protein EG028_20255 [Chitinophaga barathri]